jgi:hypothetical protein
MSSTVGAKAADTAAVTTTVISSRLAARLLSGGVGLLIVFSGCSNDDSPKAQSAASATTLAGAAVTTVAAPGSVVASPTTIAPAPGATVAPVDGAALLSQAVAATGGGYHFNQTATVDGALALTIDGDRLPDGARLAVSSDAGLVYYVITPNGAWLMPENGDWEADDSPAPGVDPIAALGAPTSVTVASNDGTTVQLVVTVPLTALGISGDGDAPLQVTISSGALTNIAYSTTTADGRAAATNTAIAPPLDTSPVVPPI